MSVWRLLLGQIRPSTTAMVLSQMAIRSTHSWCRLCPQVMYGVKLQSTPSWLECQLAKFGLVAISPSQGWWCLSHLDGMSLESNRIWLIPFSSEGFPCTESDDPVKTLVSVKQWDEMSSWQNHFQASLAALQSSTGFLDILGNCRLRKKWYQMADYMLNSSCRGGEENQVCSM